MNTQSKLMAGILCLSMAAYTCTVTRRAMPVDATGKIILDTNPNRMPLPPEQALKSIYVQNGYHLELVASEPMIQEPVAIAWDGNGRLYVAEMNTYMQTVDATGENLPVCKIKRLEDTDGDGKMDKVTTYIDSLLLPRMILPLDNRLLVSETYNFNLYSYEDTNNDGKADKKLLVYENGATDRRNLEHQRSGLVWNLDNRIYVTTDPVRYDYTSGSLRADTLYDSPGGQWGLANDDYGRLFYSSAGGETPALNFQQNPYYGYLNIDGQFDDEFQAVWPVITTPDVQGGPDRLRSDSTLNHFTACSGQGIVRGDKMPADLRGDLLICEPVGRLIRRAKLNNNEGKISMVNAYNRQEFIASTDMNFRPVNTANGPDGCMYIVDMYRGIIQEGNWTKKGSYLRPQIVDKGLDKNVGRGRIYRLVYDGAKLSKVKPNMLNETSAQLVTYLAHPNGWWRETAQKLLVLRKDRSIVPALTAMVKTSAEPLARIHALWTLNGMGMLQKDVLFTALKDKDKQVRKTAVWVADDHIKNNDAEVLDQLDAMKNDPDAEVRFQLSLTLRFNKSEKAKQTFAYLLSNAPQNSLTTLSQKRYERVIFERAESARKAKLMAEEERQLVSDGATIFKQLCATCHGMDGKGISNGGKSMPAPPLANNKDVNGDPEKLVKILLHGLKGPINGVSYPDVMPALGVNDDKYIASVLSYIRTDMGNKARVIKLEFVKQVRQKNAGRTTNWTMPELDASKK